MATSSNNAGAPSLYLVGQAGAYLDPVGVCNVPEVIDRAVPAREADAGDARDERLGRGVMDQGAVTPGGRVPSTKEPAPEREPY